MITSVYIDTDELVFQLHSVSDDAQKALEWVRSFRDTLMFGARIANPLPFAMECMAMSEGFSASGVLGKLRAAARKRLNDEGIEATLESIDAEIVRTQGADAVREIMAKIERANSLKAEIRSRKFTAATATRDGVDEKTISKKETFEALDKPGAGGKTPEIERTSASLPAPSPSRPAKRPHGEFGNVLLTDDEFAKFCEKCPDADALITELDQYIESQGKTKKYKSHYATLLNWSRRKAQEAKPKQGFKTAAEKQRDELQKIADYYASKEFVG